jgi:membrane protein implicated in regulation of membrane protease activity
MYWWILSAVIALGLLILPTLAYVMGGEVVGPYTGSRGLASYLGHIYSDAGSGRWLALLILLAPALIAAVWALRAALLRRLSPTGDSTESRA